MSSNRRRLGVAGALLVVAAAACASGPGGTPDARGADRAGATLDWSPCGTIECATLPVPLDHDEPTGETIDLALARRPADGDAIGSLLVNPGGPGAPGLELATYAEEIFGPRVLEAFDIVAWDPRGVGESTAVDCLDDLDGFWSVDRSPDTAEEVADNIDAARALVDGCEQRSGELLAHLSSRETVRDMDLIREAVGDDRLTYLGFSYGTYLGALYADAYPDRVRALVLDGAVDPSLDAETSVVEQSVGFERALDAFLADCSADPACAFHSGGDASGAYDRLMALVEAETLYADTGDGERGLGPGEADLAVASALYGGREAWPTLARALAEAARGDGSMLLTLADQYTGRQPDGSYDGSNEAFYAIGCLDGPGPRSVDDVIALDDAVSAAAPRFGPAGVWLGLPCVYWPVPPEAPPASIDAPGAPPIVVVGTTGDPATPQAWARSLADQLDSGVLLLLDDEGHTAYGRGNRCIDDAIESYLVALQPPAPGTRCPAG